MSKVLNNILLNGFYVAVIFCILASFNGFSQTKDESMFDASKDSEVTIPNTEMRRLYSRIVNQEFCIYVQLPYDYFSDSISVYPVMYITDANRSFPLVANISTILGFPKRDFPEVIIIGIGYDIKGMEEWGALRTRDLTPTSVTEVDQDTEKLIFKMSGREIDVKSGGASKFLDFIVQELIPFIETNYRVSKTDRILGGYSFGGLFAVYALFHKPEYFNKYFAGSPSLYYDNRISFQHEEEYAQKNKDLDAEIFFSVGGLEDSVMISDMEKMVTILHSRNYPSLKIESHVFENEDHRSCYAVAVMRAFKILYK
jgi:predicted alpha/beta superfamily hydrolase